MDISQIRKHDKVANAAPYYELLENDQTLPAGMWRVIASGDQLLVQRATAVDWSTYDTPLTIAQGGVAATWTILDDILLKLGTDGDVAMLNRSTSLGANTALASVLIGTPVAQAIAANSLMISDITASGDIALYVNKGGHSQMVFWADGDTGDTAVMAASGQSVDIYIAGSKIIDISATGGIALATTLTPDANRTYIALSLGTRVTEKDITMAAADNQNLDPVQIKLNIIGAAPTNTSTVNGIYQLITHDTTDMANLRIKCADWTVSVGQDATDIYVYQGEIDIVGTAAFSGEVICMSALVDLGAGTVATADRVCALQAMISGSGTAGTVTGDAIVAYFVNGGTVITTDDICRIYNQSAATVVDGLQIKNDGTMTNAIYISGTVAASIASPEAITIKPSGDTDDYFTFSTVADIPTITATGATALAIGSQLNIGANKLNWTNLRLYQGSATQFTIDENAGGTNVDLLMRYMITNAGGLQTTNEDNAYSTGQTRDNGVGLVEVYRMQGAADPYVQIGRDDTGVALNAVTDGLVLQMGAGANNEAAGFGFGLSIKLGNASSEVEERASIDFVLATATNAAEDANMIFSLMDGGVAPAAVLTLTGADKSATFAGDISIGANKLKLTYGLIKGSTIDNVHLVLRDITDASSFGLECGELKPESLFCNATAFPLYTALNSSAYFYFNAWTGAAWAEIARFAGNSGSPLVQIGRDDTGVTLNAVTDMLVLQAGGGTGNEAANFGLGISIKLGNASSEVEERASWDTVLVTATNGAEDARFDWNLMSGGTMNWAMQLAATGVLSVDLAGSGSAAQVDLFDDYDDALALKQGIQQGNRELLVNMGILERKNSGSGYFLRVQPMIKLLAGGVYQTRQMLEDVRDELITRLAKVEQTLLV